MKRPINFEIREKPGDSTDRVIKKFLKKTSKSKVIQFYLESLQVKTRAQKKRELKNRRKYIKQKIQENFLEELKKELGRNNS
jgi:ferritin-like protein